MSSPWSSEQTNRFSTDLGVDDDVQAGLMALLKDTLYQRLDNVVILAVDSTGTLVGAFTKLLTVCCEQ